jgi:hypothetical protein
MANGNSDMIPERLADLLIAAYVLFFLWSFVRLIGWL